MTKVVLIGPAVSSYVRTARMTCIEKGVDHSLEQPGNEALHPWSRVPVLRHEGLVLYETSAIARYVDEAFPGPSLLPKTPALRGKMEQWISAINAYIYDSCIRKYALCYVIPKLSGKDVDPAAVAAGVPNMQRDVARLDEAYADGGAFLAGSELSLGDLFVAPLVATLAMFPEGQQALGNAKRLAGALEKLRARPSFQQVHAGLG